MNYRHAFHAGNFADVVKHVVLALCLAHLKRKGTPFAYVDTHAGSGVYDLAGEAARRSPEWQAGIARLMGARRPPDVERVLGPYLEAVRACNPGGGLTAYPGSPAIAAHMMGARDRLHLFELHPADGAELDRRYAKDRRVKVEARDGYRGLKSALPPKERRGLVLVDPPFEQKDEMIRMAQAAVDAIPRFATGTFVFWRPLKDLWSAERFDTGLAEWLIAEREELPEKILRADLWVRDLESEGKLAGAGVMVVNPPYTLEQDLLVVLPWLCDLFRQGEGAGWRLDGGLTPEYLAGDEA
ncbi:23S rRNA (adenine(2030)-N(6))-methyltransferase RlmJ [Marinicauda algicola]|uniref:Ribosomal RNA large subunit methyltransferase J n=1 Tax=Marinicauda algicola TaxID=2029849 RepID=A0A4S2H104_9PROT|nr:23S rRNA (adenine(2030)-N(6))-methyltransferase RlmJ [Marinicauda algicola]TGY88978.1 23S rRNA (adenine(2030)-N(6))-methyltransferase RlmJ [Marinicauda algicola]